MFDEMQRLRETRALFHLLSHYAERGTADRQAWQDRLEQQEGTTSRELVRLHGELLAYGWLEQNTGATPVLRPGTAPACYRITSAGLKALKQAAVEDMQPV